MSERACLLFREIDLLRLDGIQASRLITKFEAIRAELRVMGYASSDYDLVEEFLQKFDADSIFAMAVAHSRWDTFEGMKENFIAAQNALQQANVKTRDSSVDVDTVVENAIQKLREISCISASP